MSKLLRSCFCCVALIFLGGHRVCADAPRPASYPPHWQALLPEALRTPVDLKPPADNAFVHWRKGARLLDDVELEGGDGLHDRLFELAGTGDELPWTDREVAILKGLVEGHAEALRLYRLGVAAGAAWPIPNEDFLDDSMFGSFAFLNQLGELELLQAQYLAHSGEVDAAVERVLGVLSVGGLLGAGKMATIGFVMAKNSHRAGLERLAPFASDPRLSSAGARRVLNAVRSVPPALERLTGALASELHMYTLPCVAKIRGKRVTAEVGEFLLLEDDEPQRLQDLLEGNKDPFDADATVRLLGARFEALLSPASASELRARDDGLRDDAPYGLERFATGKGSALPSAPNALGMFIADCVAESLSPLLDGRGIDAHLRGVAALYALRLYWDRHGVMPKSWAPLVADGLLDAAPRDPYSAEGAELGLSPDRGQVWSIGYEARPGEPGTRGPGTWGPEDEPLVWSLTLASSR